MVAWNSGENVVAAFLFLRSNRKKWQQGNGDILHGEISGDR
jgi:hypothetical protein